MSAISGGNLPMKLEEAVRGTWAEEIAAEPL